MIGVKSRAMTALAIVCLASVFAAEIVRAQINPEIRDADASKLYPGKAFSPYAQRAFPSELYWGETHLHTGLSLDAGLFGNTLTPDDAYRLARGEEVKSSTGLPVKLGRPLDFLVVADHSDMMGIAIDIKKGTPNILAIPEGKRWHEAFVEGGGVLGRFREGLHVVVGQALGPAPERSEHHFVDSRVAQESDRWRGVGPAAWREPHGRIEP